MRKLLPTFLLFLTTLVTYAQSDVDVTAEEQPLTLTAVDDEVIPFVENFEPSNVGFLHIYVDPAVDPLETYLLRGAEMTTDGLALLPQEFQQMIEGDSGKFYGTIAVMGIEENLYVTRYKGSDRDQIDMFAARDGDIIHLKTLAYLNCDTPGDCAQLDSYLTDLNLDTTFDLVQIERQSEDGEESRSVYTMPRDTRMWVETEELDVPWEGITFYRHPSANRNH